MFLIPCFVTFVFTNSFSLFKRYFTEATLIFVAVIWALNFSVIKASLTEIDPFSFNALRYLFAAGLLISVAKFKGFKITVSKEHLLPVLGIGLVGNLVYQVLFIVGMNYTKAANAAVILGTIPVWVAVLSHFFSDEKLNPTKLLGIILAFSGVVLIIFGKKGTLTDHSQTMLGDFIILLSAIAWAGYTILSKKYLKIYHPYQYSGFMALVGGVSLFLVGIPSLMATNLSELSLAGFGGIIYSGLLSVGLSYLIWNRGITKIGATKTAAFQNLVPVLGVLFGVILLNEALTVGQLFGCTITIIGIYFSRF